MMLFEAYKSGSLWASFEYHQYCCRTDDVSVVVFAYADPVFRVPTLLACHIHSISPPPRSMWAIDIRDGGCM